MSTYRKIHGRSIQAVTTDPTGDIAEGQVWYNTTSDTFKSTLLSEAWASSGPLTTARKYLAGCGIQTSALAFGGTTGSETASTEEYNGSGFSSGGNLNTARMYLAGCGTQTAGLAVGGAVPPSATIQALVEEYDGGSWTESGDLSTARKSLAAAGIQTSAVAFGGRVGGSTLSDATENYNGTSWTSGGALSTARKYLAGAGTQTAALAFGGKTPSNTGSTEEYDGSSWTTSPGSLNDARGYLAGAGTQTSALAFGGYNNKTSTEQYDGSTWSTKPALATGRESLAGGGATAAAAVGFGGNTTAVQSLTEEFTSSINVITASAWASGGNINTARRVGASSRGGSVSGLIFGGDDVPLGAGNPQLSVTEEYDGSSWTNGGSIQNRISGTAGAGTQTAAIGATGYSFSNTAGVPNPSWATAGASYVSNAFEYDGSSWTNVTAYPTTAVGMISLGTQTAALFGGGAQGGSPGPEANQKSKNYKEYDGTSWTTGGSSNTYHSRSGATGGTQTAGVIYGGYDSPGGNPSNRSDKVEEYNGTAWTSALTAPKENALGGGFGTQTAFLSCAGEDSPTPNSPGTTGFQFNTLIYDGTTMRTDANTATRRKAVGSDGSIGSAAGFVCGGATSYSARTTATEEYSQGSTAVNTKTLTQS